MRSDLLHVVTVISNPIRWRSRIELYHRFEKHMLASGVKLTVVECAYGEREYEIKPHPDVTHIGVRAKTLLWTKENMCNIGLHRLPAEAKYIAFIDADIEFRNKDWASETVHYLQQYDIVQPWGNCYDLGPKGEHIQTHTSFCKMMFEDKAILASAKTGYEFAHPGYAWAYTRTALEWLGGLIDIAILGAGDHHMAQALINRVDSSAPGNMTHAYMRHLHQWQDRAQQHIRRNVSFVPGTIEHFWHGKKELRKYVDRWAILTSNKYDPDHDVKKNTYGIFELTGNKPKLAHEIDRYFRARDEDSNSLM